MKRNYEYDFSSDWLFAAGGGAGFHFSFFSQEKGSPGSGRQTTGIPGLSAAGLFDSSCRPDSGGCRSQPERLRHGRIERPALQRARAGETLSQPGHPGRRPGRAALYQ